MIEQDLKVRLDEINENLIQIKKNGGVWKSFFRGILTGIGSVLGVALALILIGWILNTIGVIPAFREQAREWQQTLEDIKRIR
jgi:hypothetical protein